MSTEPELKGYSVIIADGREVFGDCTKAEAEHFASSLPTHVGAVVVPPVIIKGRRWYGPSRRPGSGESVWMAIISRHGGIWVDYAVVFDDVDGLIVHRLDADDYEQWPPKEMLMWTLCEVPEFCESTGMTG